MPVRHASEERHPEQVRHEPGGQGRGGQRRGPGTAEHDDGQGNLGITDPSIETTCAISTTRISADASDAAGVPTAHHAKVGDAATAAQMIRP